MFHCSVKTISRSAGRSATAAAAYRTASEIVCERTGEVHDYSRKAGVEHSQIITPEAAPAWAHDRSSLWNAAEQAETRKNSTVAREWEVGLPHQLDADQRRDAAVEYGRWLSDRYGIAVEVAVHAPGKEGDQRNYHAHILASTRQLGPDGFGAKTRELDDKKQGVAEVVACREEWAKVCNRALERAQVHERVDHRSLKDQRQEALERGEERRAQDLDRAPTVHLGPTATAMERQGIQTDRGDQNRTIRAENTQRQNLWEQVREWGGQIRDRAHQVVDQVKDQARDLAHSLRDRLASADLSGLRSASLTGGLASANLSGLRGAQDQRQEIDRQKERQQQERQRQEAERKRQEQERQRQEAERQRQRQTTRSQSRGRDGPGYSR